MSQERAEELAALLDAGLGEDTVYLEPCARGTAVYLQDAAGDLLANDRATLNDRKVNPIMAALVPDPDQPDAALVGIYLEDVPGTPVEYAGNASLRLKDAADHLVRHYRPALTRPAAPTSPQN